VVAMFTFATSAWRGKNDTGSGANTTDWIDAQNTNWTQTVDVNFRVRFRGGDTGGATGTWTTPQLQYQLTPSGGSPGGFNNVTGSSSVVRATVSPNVADDAATTTQLTGGSGGAFVGGTFDEVDGAVASVSLGASGNSEVEYCVQILSGDVANGDTVELRVLNGGAAPTETNGHPSLTVSEAGAALGPVRHFDGTDDVIRFPATGYTNITQGAFSIAVLFRKPDTDTAAAPIWFANAAAPGTFRMLMFAGGTDWRLYLEGGVEGFGAADPPDNVWVLAVITKASGTVFPRLHTYNYATTTWTHTNTNNAMANGTLTADSVYLGGGSGNFLDGYIAAAGIWTTALSDGDCETMEAALQAWADLNPAWLVRLNQASVGTAVEDLIDGNDQDAITGTAANTTTAPDPFDFDVVAPAVDIDGDLAVTAGLSAGASVVAGAVDVDGSLAATAALTADAARVVGVDGSLGVTAALSADATVAAGGIDVDGSLAATVGLSADVASVVAVGGSLAATAAVTADATRTISIDGALPVTAATAATVASVIGVDGALPVTAGLSADASVAGAAQGDVDGTLAITAALTAETVRGLSVDGMAAVTAGLTADVATVIASDGALPVTVGLSADATVGVIEPTPVLGASTLSLRPTAIGVVGVRAVAAALIGVSDTATANAAVR
jgi:hypothetical protein